MNYLRCCGEICISVIFFISDSFAPSPRVGSDDSDSSGGARPARKRAPVYNSSSTSATSEGSRGRARSRQNIDWVEDVLDDSDSSISSRSSSRSRRSRSNSPLSYGSVSPVRPSRKKMAKIRAARARWGLGVPINSIDSSDSSARGSASETDSYSSFVTVRSRASDRRASGSSFNSDDYETATSEVDHFPELEGKGPEYRMQPIPYNQRLSMKVVGGRLVPRPPRKRKKAPSPQSVGEPFVPPSLGVVAQSGEDENSFVIRPRRQVTQTRPVRRRSLAIVGGQRENALTGRFANPQKSVVFAPDADSFVIPPREEVDRLRRLQTPATRKDADAFVPPALDGEGSID